MVCIYCGTETEISNTRNQKRTNTKWRRRNCPKCKAVLTTIEAFDLSKAISVTSNKSSQSTPFLRDKLLLSVYNCCKHLDNPLQTATDLSNTVISKLLPQVADACLSDLQIRQTVAEVLSNFDKPAHTQYCAYHPESRYSANIK